MIEVTNILLASHGTPGARAAERAAIKACGVGAKIKHLIVVPKMWKGMMGDDWLNTGATRDRFGRYLEKELGKEVDENCDRLQQLVENAKLQYQNEIVLGEPDQCLIDASKMDDYDLVVIGGLRPKGEAGLKSRMLTEYVIKNIKSSLLVVPYPGE